MRKNDKDYYKKNREGKLLYQKDYARTHQVEIQAYKAKRIKFKDKRIFLETNPRIGVCSWCRKKGRTNIHHLQYDENNPLAHTVEICPSCHIKEHLAKKRF